VQQYSVVMLGILVVLPTEQVTGLGFGALGAKARRHKLA